MLLKNDDRVFGLIIYVPPNIYIENLTPNMMEFRGFGK